MPSNYPLYTEQSLSTFYAQVLEDSHYLERLTRLRIIQNQHKLMQKMPFLRKYH